MTKKNFVIVVMATVLLAHAAGDIFGLGACPPLKVHPGFDIKMFLGRWYVVQSHATSGACLRREVSRSPDGRFYLIQSGSTIGGLPLVGERSGELVIPQTEPAKMTVKRPLNIMRPNLDYWVLATDYKNVAITWTCRDFLLGHLHGLEILSREPSLDFNTFNTIKQFLHDFNLEPGRLVFVNQKDCEHTEEKPALTLSLTSLTKFIDRLFTS